VRTPKDVAGHPVAARVALPSEQVRANLGLMYQSADHVGDDPVVPPWVAEVVGGRRILWQRMQLPRVAAG
jgi:hypothetical protein